MLEKSKQEQYDQLVQRIKREKQLGIIGAKMQAKINLKVINSESEICFCEI